ncbi:DUF1206 domain-containing protein [Arthrobacter rhombi]|uniref:DUF1206 domain-containing protein n=1 Tax=Arthrobacter rhombi TaxID=71253 RepID=UPI0031DCCDE7
MGTTEEAVDGAREAAHSQWFERVARTGFAANGVLHLTMGFLAIKVGRASGGEASQSGAISTLAKQPGGDVLIWICALGCLLLGVWCVAQTVFPGSGGAFYRIKQAGTAVVFGVIGSTFIRYALGSSKGSSEQSSTASSTLMSSGPGSVALVVAGLVVIGIGGYFVYRGVSRSFQKILRPQENQTMRWLVNGFGTVGYVAKGLVLAAVGLLFIVATLQHDPQDATGVDGALQAVRDQPAGPAALTAMAVGLMAYGIFLFLRARYDQME